MFRSAATPSRTALVAIAFISLTTLAAPAAHAGRRIFTSNAAPQISGTAPTSVVAGSSYRFQPTATDADGDRLSFRIVNKPLWATFSKSTGLLSGTPASAYVGTYAGIEIRVSDGQLTAALPKFSVTVTAPVVNQAPVISGDPAVAAQSGQPYSFKPTASDPDGNALTFSIQNKPVWAAFDAATGTLYGTPSDAHVGSYASIVISASDGKATTSLPAFTITVALPLTRNATLNWTPPTQNIDGTPIENLAGFKVLYGTTPGQYDSLLSLPSATMTSVVLEGLAPGTWYFTVTAVNTSGVESDYSNVVSKLL